MTYEYEQWHELNTPKGGLYIDWNKYILLKSISAFDIDIWEYKRVIIIHTAGVCITISEIIITLLYCHISLSNVDIGVKRKYWFQSIYNPTFGVVNSCCCSDSYVININSMNI